MDVSGGSLTWLSVYQNSPADISGGTIASLEAYGESTVYISGGSITGLEAYDMSITTLHGYDFQASAGLSLQGNVSWARAYWPASGATGRSGLFQS